MSLLIFGMPVDEVKLSEIADLVSVYGEDHGWDDFLVMKVNLLLEELVLNVRDYGEVSGRRFDVEIGSNPGGVSLDFSDNGVRFDPTTEAPVPDLVSGLDHRQEGGLGVHLVRSFADSIAYRYEGGWNMLSVGLCSYAGGAASVHARLLAGRWAVGRESRVIIEVGAVVHVPTSQ